MQLTREEKLKMVWDDPILFIQNFMKIIDKNGKEVPFILNDMQRDFVEGKQRLNVILKARQGGMSVCIAALSLYYAITESHSSCILLSHNEESTRTIFNKLKAIYNSIPKAIKPKLIRNNRQELMLANGSIISCTTISGASKGRGNTLKLIHLSELGFVESEKAKQQLLSLEQALRPDGHLIIESTPNGLNHFHDIYLKAKNKESPYKSFFYNYIDTSCMFADDYKNSVEVWESINNRKFTIDELDEEEQELLKIEGMTLPILVWRRLKIQNSGLDEFNQEYAISDVTCFITTGQQVFSNKRIDDVERAILTNKEKYIHKDNLIDLPDLLKRLYGRSLFIYHDVEPDVRYYLGIDASEGVKQDYSVIEVFNQEGQQVAEYYSNTMKPYEVAEVANELGRYYNKGLINCERASGGHTIIEKLRNEYQYYNMLKQKMYDERNKAIWRLGFDTNTKTKSMIIQDFIEMFETGQIQINSRRVLQEMKVFTVNDRGKMGATNGNHDDSIISVALAIHAMKSIFYKF